MFIQAHKIDGEFRTVYSCPFDSLVQTLFVIGIDENIKEIVDK